MPLLVVVAAIEAKPDALVSSQSIEDRGAEAKRIGRRLALSFVLAAVISPAGDLDLDIARGFFLRRRLWRQIRRFASGT